MGCCDNINCGGWEGLNLFHVLTLIVLKGELLDEAWKEEEAVLPRATPAYFNLFLLLLQQLFLVELLAPAILRADNNTRLMNDNSLWRRMR